MRVLLVDDDARFRALARALVAGHDGIVVGEAADADSALSQARDAAPDLVLVDVHLGQDDGRDVAERLLRAEGAPAVLLTSSDDGVDPRGVPFVAKPELPGVDLRAFLA